MEKVILLADKESKAWDFAEKIRTYIQDERKVSIPLEEVSIKHFRNQEIQMHIPENLRGKDVYFIHDSTKNPQEWWVELLLLKDLLLSSSARTASFVLPDMLYSRQDRKHRPHVPISARALSDSISPGLEKIITMDLHAPQIQGIYPAEVPLDNLYSFPETVRYFREHYFDELEDLVVVAPDAGGAKRARTFLNKLEAAQNNALKKQRYSFALIDKIRLKSGEIECMELVGEVKDKNVLIIDDIIDSGRTLCEGAKLLRENGAKKLFGYGTHGIFTEGTKTLLTYFDKIITSNTHYQENSGVEVVDVSQLFAEAIYRAEKGLSISKLFEVN